MTNAKQVYEWVKTGHWNRRQFLEWAQPVPPRTWVGSGDLEDSNAYLTPPQRTERHELQAKGEHPAPCARHCEANAFQIVIKNLKAQLAQPEQEPVADDIASILACRDMLDAQVVPPRTWVGSGDLEDSNAYLTPPQRTWVGLTDEQVRKCFFLGDAPPSSPPHWWEYRNSDYLKIYAFIEAELKEQNT